MKTSQKLELRQSEIRQSLAGKISDDEAEKLQNEYGSNEIKLRSALIAESQEELVEPKGEKKEDRDWASLVEAFQAGLVLRHQLDDHKLEGVEVEVLSELESRGMTSRNGGIVVPLESLAPKIETRNVQQNDVSNFARRPQLPAVNRFFENSVATRFGFRTVSVSGQPRIPVLAPDAAASWVAEGSGAATAGITTSALSPTLKTVSARYDVSRQALRENALIDGILRTDIRNVIVEAIDKAAFQGSGSSNQPSGLGSLITGDSAVDVSGNVLFPQLVGYARKLMETSKASTIGGLTMASHPVMLESLINSLVEGTAVSDFERAQGLFQMIFSAQVSGRDPITNKADENGDTTVYLSAPGAALWILQWGGIELLADPYSRSGQSEIALHIWSFNDVAAARTDTHLLKRSNVTPNGVLDD